MLNIKVEVWDTQVPRPRAAQSREEKIVEMLPTARAVMAQNWGLVMRSKLEAEDVRQELYLIVVNCVDKYDERCDTKLSTYVWSACKKRLTELARVQNSKKRYFETVSMSSPIDPSDSEVSYEDVMGEASFEETIINNMAVLDAIRRIRESLSPKDRGIFDGLLAGEKQTQMAKKFNCTQPAISNRVNTLRRTLQWLLKEQM